MATHTCVDTALWVYFDSVKELNRYTADPSVGRKHQGKLAEERGSESHSYDRLKIDQISANRFF